MALEQSLDVIQFLAKLTAVSDEAIRLVLTLLSGYPIAWFYWSFIIDITSRRLHHMYFAFLGITLCYFNYGNSTLHILIGVFTTYALLLTTLPKPRLFLSLNFIFHMTYLLAGYWLTASTGYDILWTMPQCILCIRMIGLGFDITDGLRPEEELSKDQKKTALPQIPSMLGLLAFAFFPSGFLVGPQFPYRRYQRFINGEYRQYKGFVRSGLTRLLIGLLYLAIRQIGARFFSDDYLLSDAFRNESFLMKLVYLGLWGKISLYKYISCWLITEGALMCLGFTFDGLDEKEEPNWYGCSNVYLHRLETGYKMNHYVESFNVNTNHWVAQYIYKRLKFMNNRTISYAAALAFLAVWHGFHSGYYITFFLEYAIVTSEKHTESLYKKAIIPKYGDVLNNLTPLRLIKYFLLKVYNIVCMGWCLIAFVYLKYDRWLPVMSAVHYFGFICLIAWAILNKIVAVYARASSRAEQDKIFSRATELSPVASHNLTKED